MKDEIPKTVVLIVAHPDDEILWAGGTILSHPTWQWFIISLCRKNDADRSPRFFNVLKILGANGTMGDLDDGPEQIPLDEKEVERAILQLLPAKNFDLIISHNPTGEYTRHLRHEEVSRAVIHLWHAHQLIAPELWTFAYEDGNKTYLPQAIKTADLYFPLTDQFWKDKYNLITKIYGFQKNGWEASTTPKEESFWQFTNSEDAMNWIIKGERL